MPCTHDLCDRENACADGMCPQCLAEELAACKQKLAEQDITIINQQTALREAGGFCPRREDATHCEHWWDGDKNCCDCGAGQPGQGWFDDVLQFVRASKRRISAKPTFTLPDYELRLRLIVEEFVELLDAMGVRPGVGKYLKEQLAGYTPPLQYIAPIEDIADAMVDLTYVLCGGAISFGLDLREVWREVHAANMRKFPPEGPKIVDNKIVKPDGWVPPNVKAALERGFIKE